MEKEINLLAVFVFLKDKIYIPLPFWRVTFLSFYYLTCLTSFLQVDYIDYTNKQHIKSIINVSPKYSTYTY